MSDTDKTKDFASLTDEELVSRIRSGASKAFDELAARYGKSVSALSGKYFSEALTDDDWFQEGMIGFLFAVRSFDASKNVSFSTYANVCISNRLRSAWKKANSNANAPLNESIELDESFIPPVVSTEENYIENESHRSLADGFTASLSESEKKVISCYIAGYSYSETAKQLDMTEKSVDNALCRAKAKLKKALKK